MTLDGEPVVTEGQAGVLVGIGGRRGCPRSPIRASCTWPGRRPTGGLAVLLSDERLARRLRALGYDPSRLGGAHPAPGSFRPLDPGELDAVRALARSAQRARARARDGEPEAPPAVD